MSPVQLPPVLQFLTQARLRLLVHGSVSCPHLFRGSRGRHGSGAGATWRTQDVANGRKRCRGGRVVATHSGHDRSEREVRVQAVTHVFRYSHGGSVGHETNTRMGRRHQQARPYRLLPVVLADNVVLHPVQEKTLARLVHGHERVDGSVYAAVHPPKGIGGCHDAVHHLEVPSPLRDARPFERGFFDVFELRTYVLQGVSMETAEMQRGGIH